jgi:hypothetical protein
MLAPLLSEREQLHVLPVSDAPWTLAPKVVQRPLIRIPVVEFHNGLGEFRIRRHRAEQCHRGMEFQVVGAAEDFADRPALDGIDERGAFSEPGSQDTMAEIGDGLIARGGYRDCP